jgi:hypothetical protein
MLAILCSLNFQITICLFLWLLTGKLKFRGGAKLYLPLLFYFLALFFIVDVVFLEGWYAYMIMNTIEFGWGNEFSEYYRFASLSNYLWGIAPWHMPDPYDRFSYAIPLTDFGVFGYPLQHGIFGVVSTLIFIRLTYKAGSKEFRRFLIILCFSILHYFPLVSLPGVLSLTWLSLYSAGFHSSRARRGFS